MKEKLLTGIIYFLTTGLGIFAYLYPLLETSNQGILSSNRQNELPIMMAMILALCSIVLIYEIQQYRLNTKLIALLGILIAVEMVPDVFRTIGNVTGDLAVTTLAQRRDAAATADQPVAGSPRT